ncbi:hypothetical protein [Methanosarcina siciliae]|nr:hypothetical protein [Methanosarcina siciliae]
MCGITKLKLNVVIQNQGEKINTDVSMSAEKERKADILQHIKKPIHIFSLVFLIPEGLLTLMILLGNLSESDKSRIILSMILLTFVAFISFIFVLYKKPQVFENSNVSSQLSTKEETSYLKSAGLVNVFSSRSVSIEVEYSKRLEKMSKNLDVIGFGLSHFRRDYGKKFIELSGKGKVRILLIDPEFHLNEGKSISDLRDIEENQDIGSIRSQVKDFIRDYKKLKEILNSDNFEVRVYNCLPSVNIFRIDNEMFIGPYLINRDSRRTVTVLVNSTGELFEQHMEHFEEIWNNYSRKIDE